MNDRIISKEGLEELKRELEDLTTVKRPEIVRRIEVAKALGDLSENAEYHDAKEALGFADSRISELRDLVHSVTVVEPSVGAEVGLGSKVDVLIGTVQKAFHIVGASEANPASGKISNESPIGKALFGHKEGEEVEVETPAGKTIFTIVKVS